MRVVLNEKTEELILVFSLRHRLMGTLVLEWAVKMYKDAGFDVEEIEAVLRGLQLTEPTIQ